MGELTKTFISKTLFTDLEGSSWREPRVQQSGSRPSTDQEMAVFGPPVVISSLPADPDHVIMQGGGSENDIYRYNLRNGTINRIMLLADRDVGVYVDRLGVPMAKRRGGSDSKGVFVALDFRNANSGSWEEHFRQYVKDREVVDIIWASSKTGKAVIKSNVGKEFNSLLEYDIAGRQVLSTLFEHQFLMLNKFRAASNKNLKTMNYLVLFMPAPMAETYIG